MPDHIRPYEPLTSENAALILVDHQLVGHVAKAYGR
jgi:hypothetical protein